MSAAKLFRPLLHLLVGVQARQLINVTFQLILVRVLTPEIFGTYALCLFYIEFGFFPSSLFSQKTCLKYASDDGVLASILKSSTLVTFINLLILLILIGIFAPFNVLVIVSVLGGLKIFSNQSVVFESRLERTVKYKDLSISEVLPAIFSFVVAVPLAFLFPTIFPILLRDIIHIFFKWQYLRTKMKNFSFEGAKVIAPKPVLKFGVEQIIDRILELLYLRGPVIIIQQGISDNNYTLGVWDRVRYLKDLPESMISPIVHRFAYALYIDNNRTLDADKTFKIHFLFTGLFSLICSAIIYKFPANVVMLLLGEQWIFAIGSLQAASIFVFSRPLSVVVIQYNRAHDHPHLNQVSYLVGIVVFYLLADTDFTQQSLPDLIFNFSISALAQCIFLCLSRYKNFLLRF